MSSYDALELQSFNKGWEIDDINNSTYLAIMVMINSEDNIDRSLL